MYKRFNVEKFLNTKYGEWTIVEHLGMIKNGNRIVRMCVAKCSCGKIFHKCVYVFTGVNGIKACRDCSRTTHGMTNTATYHTWAGMIQRCNNPNFTHYKRYGGRGIKVCERWLNSFENFFKDMGEKPKGLSIERINNNKGYNPSNCKWATRKEQAQNRDFSNMSKGESHKKTFFKEADILKIRKLAKINNFVTIAKIFNVKQNTISGIVNRKSWKHI